MTSSLNRPTPAVPLGVMSARSAITAFCAGLALDRGRIEDVRLVVTEASTGCVLSCNGHGPESTIVIEASLE